MSVINRVLSQLERRGVHVEQELGMVRAVPPQRSRRMLPMMALLLALATWWWLGRGVVVGGAKPQRAVASVASVVPAGPASGIVAQDIIAVQSGVPVAVSAVPAVVPVSAVAEVAVQSTGRVQPTPKPAPHTAPKPAPLPKAVVSAPPKPAALAAQAQPPGKPRVAPVGPSANRGQKPQAHPDSRQPAPPTPASDGMPMKQVSRAQQADAEFRKGVESMQSGRSNDAMVSYQAALQLDGGHDAARQALVALLLEDKRSSDAERLLQERLTDRPQHTGFAMLLARLQVERGATGEALVTLERSLPHAEARADYLAFLAALQQRNNRHAEAVNHYQAALQLQPDNGAWLMGYGISLQALRHTEEARAAYQKALDSKTLSPDLQAFVQRKLKGL